MKQANMVLILGAGLYYPSTVKILRWAILMRGVACVPSLVFQGGGVDSLDMDVYRQSGSKLLGWKEMGENRRVSMPSIQVRSISHWDPVTDI